MSLLFATGFENGTLYGVGGGLDYLGSSISATTPRTGNYKMTLDNSSGYFYGVGVTPSNTIVSGVVCNIPNLGSFRFRFFTTTEANILDVRHGSDGLFRAYVNNVLVGTSISAFPIGEWIHIEVKITIADVGGTFQVKLNGNLEIDYIGDTKPGTATTIDRVQLYKSGINTTSFDDFFIDNANWQGDLRFVALTPTADTTTKDWTPSTGSDNYAMVYDIPPNDADYISSATDGDQDLYSFSDFDNSGLTPQVLVQWGRGLTETADGQGLKLLLYSGTTLTTGSTNSLALSYRNFYEIYETDPDTGIAWTDSGIDAIQAGQESVIP